MRLSIAAKNELRDILYREIGAEALSSLNDEAVNDLGSRLLRLTALALKQGRMK